MENHISTSTLRTLLLSFNLPIYARQISQWRGAFIEMAGLDDDLFHNHISADKYHYRYPLIHYRMYKGRASISAFNEGIDAVQRALSQNAWEVNWQGSRQLLSIEDMRMNEHHLRMLPHPKTYRLYKWLPFNSKNYEKWQECDGMLERVALLERVLASQLLAFAGGVGYRLPERLEVRLQDIQSMEMVRCHGTPMLAFNVSYTANLLLPPHIAIGNSVSHGFGWQVAPRVPKYTKNRGNLSEEKVQTTEDSL